MRSSQFRKTANRNRNRNKRKTWRNKRTKNARGGGFVNGKNMHDRKNYEYYGEVNYMNQPHGTGLRKFIDTKGFPGQYYGEMQYGKKHGTGRMIYKDEQYRDVICEGEWEYDKMNGVGKQQFYNDENRLTTLEGIWKDDQLAKGPYKKTIGKNSIFLGEILDDGTEKGEWIGLSNMEEVDG
jgi:hypothetical protein